MFNQKPGILRGVFCFVLGIAFLFVGLYFGELKNESKKSNLALIQNSSQSSLSSWAESYAPSPMLQLQVEVLDSNNPPKYVTDYLTCQKTSPTKQFGTMTEDESGNLIYRCPKSLDYYGCKENIFFGEFENRKNVEGWNCDLLGFGNKMTCENALFPLIYDGKNNVEEINNFDEKLIKKFPTQNQCVMILDSSISDKELQKINQQLKLNFVPGFKLKLITIKN